MRRRICAGLGGKIMKTVLLTGAGGFIGRYAAEELKSIGCVVYPFEGDMLKEDLHAYMARLKPEYLVHLAWVTGEGYLDSPKNLIFAQKSIELYRAFYECGGKRAVFVGTEQEYARTGSIFSEDSPLEPRSLYAKCKASLGTMLVSDSLCRNNGFVWARIFFVYGAGEKPARLMPSVVSALSQGHNVTCSCADFVRDYVYVKDLSSALCRCLFSAFSGFVNISGGHDTTIGEIASIIKGQLGNGSVSFRSAEECGNQPPYLRGDVSRLKSLGWKPRFTLEQGIAEEIAFLTEERND